MFEIHSAALLLFLVTMTPKFPQKQPDLSQVRNNRADDEGILVDFFLFFSLLHISKGVWFLLVYVALEGINWFLLIID